MIEDGSWRSRGSKVDEGCVGLRMIDRDIGIFQGRGVADLVFCYSC